MAKRLQIAQLGNLILRKTAAEIQNVLDPACQSLFDDLLATMTDANGLGIAAPQVYENARCFIFASRPNPRFPDAPVIPPTVVINPKLLHTSERTVKVWEVCLSVPGIRGFVPRPETIKVTFVTANNSIREEHLTGLAARVFQHELDHLNGLVFLDRLESNKDIISEKEFQRLWSNP